MYRGPLHFIDPECPASDPDCGLDWPSTDYAAWSVGEDSPPIYDVEAISYDEEEKDDVSILVQLLFYTVKQKRKHSLCVAFILPFGKIFQILISAGKISCSQQIFLSNADGQHTCKD